MPQCLCRLGPRSVMGRFTHSNLQSIYTMTLESPSHSVTQYTRSPHRTASLLPSLHGQHACAGQWSLELSRRRKLVVSHSRGPTSVRISQKAFTHNCSENPLLLPLQRCTVLLTQIVFFLRVMPYHYNFPHHSTPQFLKSQSFYCTRASCALSECQTTNPQIFSPSSSIPT